MRWNLHEVYKCAILTVIAGLLGAILWRMPPKPLTMEQVRAARVKGTQKELMGRIPLVYVSDGSITVESGNITVDNLEDPLPVEVENEVQIEIDR